MPILAVENLTMRFGGLTAIDDVSFTAEAGQITAIIGPNGAGKTTLFNCLTGFYRPSAGRMTLHHNARTYDLGTLPGHKIVTQARMARTFQNIRLFGDMSVLENLLVAQNAYLSRASLCGVGGLLELPRYRQARASVLKRATTWLDYLGLRPYADSCASSLSYGLQRKVEIARALCIHPSLLCLDEPAAGLNPAESAQLNQLLAGICQDHGITILLIEHDMSVVMNISQHIVVIDYGKKIATGTPAEIKANPAVIRAYLGEPDMDVA